MYIVRRKPPVLWTVQRRVPIGHGGFGFVQYTVSEHKNWHDALATAVVYAEQARVQ